MQKQISFRRFTGGYGVSEDYLRLHDFLVESGNTEYTYGRLDWMITHRPYLEEEHLDKIGIWQEGERIVAATLFDTSLDDIFPVVLEGYQFLYPEMVEYAQSGMVKMENPDFRLFISDSNFPLRQCAEKLGFQPTEDKDYIACYDMAAGIPQIRLPEGYSLVSLAEERDYEKYARCLFEGFGHEEAGETFEFSPAEREQYRAAFERDKVDLHLKISVKAPNGAYVSHCGMWYDRKADFSLIEPVATSPQYRKMGLGRAAVLEGIRRTKELGAKFAVVGSNQPFYYSIGLRPFTEGAFWVKQPSDI